jgi:hypothetical protein
MRRISFLTIFFICLTAALAVAVGVRVKSYRERASSPDPAADAMRDSSGPAATVPRSSTAAIAGGAAASEQATVAATASERARLREELLRQPIPVVPGRSGAAPGNTGANAGAAAQKAPVTPQRATAVAATAQPQRITQPLPSSSSNSGRSQSTEQPQPKDPNSDTMAPQLVSLEFDPPQVEDGQEARLVIVATDDSSGVRGLSGTITSPTGKALQGFAGSREADTNRFIGRFIVPKNAEEGVWRVNVVTMSDNASNTVTLSLGQGTLPPNAGLRVVSSQSDSTPPVLKGARAERPAMRVGQGNPIWIEAEDDKSGVNLVSAVLHSPTRKARIGAGCSRTDADTWKCEMALPNCIDCGEWQLEQITLQDKANNLATYRTDNPIVAAVKINIGGDSCDNEAPRLHGLLFDQTVISMSGEPAQVTVTISVTDDVCGVEGVSAQFTGPGAGTGGFFALQRSGDDQTWIGKIPLDPKAPRGVWRVSSVQVTDRAHNLRIYYGTDPLLANATFQVR